LLYKKRITPTPRVIKLTKLGDPKILNIYEINTTLFYLLAKDKIN